MKKLFVVLAAMLLLVSCSSKDSTSAPAASAKAITAFSIAGVVGTINETGKTIAVTMPYGTDVTALVATFTTTGSSATVGSTTQVSGTTANNFTSPVIYTVTAADSSSTTYTVTVAVASSSAKAITAFSLAGVVGTINETGKTIAVTMPYGTDVTALVATFTTTGSSATVGSTAQVSGTTANNFTSPVVYTVTAADSSSITYTVTVTVALSSEKAITAFSLAGVVGTINEAGKTIAVTMPYGTGVTNLIATFTTTGSSVTVGSTAQVSGTTANNFTSPVVYTVTAADSSSTTYTVTVTVALSSEKALTAFSLDGVVGTINESGKTIAVTMPFDTDVTALVATFTTTGSSVTVGSTAQISGTTANNFTSPVVYTVTAADSSSTTYTVTVTVAAPLVSLPQTGQTSCYDSSGNTIACTGTGQDGALQEGVVWPSPRFTNNSDGTITDKLTGLMWTQNANTPGPACSPGGAQPFETWQGALTYVACLNTNIYLGYTDWRLPNVNELNSLVNSSQVDMADWLNSVGFSGVWITDYWSSTPATITGYARFVDMTEGIVTQAATGFAFPVWPVRTGPAGTVNLPQTGQTSCYNASGTVIACTGTGQDGALQEGVAWPSPRFTNNNDGTITDNLNGLMWTQNADAPGPPGCNPGTTVTWQGALNYAACLNTNIYLGYTDWRLPNREELRTLVNYGQTNPGTWLNTQGFSNVQANWYWSSTTVVASPPAAWAVLMTEGNLFEELKTSSHYVWPVRAGQ